MPQAFAQPDEPAHDIAVRDLCARLFREPARLVDTVTHPLPRPFEIAPHRHDDLLQLDIIVGCGGRAMVDSTWQDIRGVCTMVTYPQTEHGYRLQPVSPNAQVWLVKLRVEPGMSIAAERSLPAFLTDLGGSAGLVEAIAAVVRLGTVQATRSPLLLARLAELLGLWPRGKDAASPGRIELARALDAREEASFSAVLERISESLDAPPDVAEMARTAHLSPRHFARRFRMLFGCTPHQYVSARRLERARQMLLGQRMTVGQVAEALGFGSLATFSRWFSSQAGTSPSTYRSDPSSA